MASGKPRSLKVHTVKRWIAEDLAKSNAELWLDYSVSGMLVTDLKCKICKKYESTIRVMRDFSDAWIVGSKNLKISNAKDHASTKCHSRACDLYKKDTGCQVGVDKKDPKQSTILQGFCHGEQQLNDQITKKFEIAYFVAKNELPFTMYEKIARLEEHHDVDIGPAYVNRVQCGEFVDIHGEYLAESLKKELLDSHFISVLTDGSTDSSITEKECIYVLYFNKQAEVAEPKLVFLYLKDLAKGDAKGIKAAIESSFEKIGITKQEFYKRLIGLGADGASVNSGQNSGLAALLRAECPWLVFQWCIAHKLELALKDALDKTYFKDVDHMLMRLYYLYHKSPKKLSELKTLASIMSNTFDFVEGSLKPKKACGTRWISFKLNALRLVLDKYGLYITHLEKLSTERGNDEIIGYLRKWKSCKMLLHVAFFIDVLTPASLLSQAVQHENIDIVSSIAALRKVQAKMQQLINRDFERLTVTKYLLSKIVYDDNFEHCSYQGVKFSTHSFNESKQFCKAKKQDILESVNSCILARTDNTVVQKVEVVLNTELWLTKSKSNHDSDSSGEEVQENFADDEINSLYEHFDRVIGHQCPAVTVLEEWHDLVNYTLTYLNPSKSVYKETWKIIFQSSHSKERWQNIIPLIELLFSIPVSNAKLERMFSKVKRIKTDSRCCLGEHRLTNLLRIVEEGPEIGKFDVSPIVRLWREKKVRRPNQKASRAYKGRKRQKKYYEEDALELQSSGDSSGSSESSSDSEETNLEAWWNDNIISTSEEDSDGFEGY